MWFSCIITSFKYTKFLGEADRYVEFGAIFPCTILCVLLAFNNQTSLNPVLFNFIMHWLVLST